MSDTLADLGIFVGTTDEYGTVWPIELVMETSGESEPKRRVLSVEEAEELVTATRAAIEAANEANYVVVELGRFSIPYTYSDPTGTVQVGDRVTVSGAASESIGTVVQRGRGKYTGKVYETVTGKVVSLS